MKRKKSNQNTSGEKRMQSSLIPSKGQYGRWSIPSKVTYISFILSIIGLAWAILTFVIPLFFQNDNANQLNQLSTVVGELKKMQNEELLQLVNDIRRECLDFSEKKVSAQSCEIEIEEKTGLSEIQISEVAKDVIKRSNDYLDLGNAYYYLRNFEKALEYFLKAANQGDPQAFYSLGDMYLYGHGVDQNFIEAEKWFRKAADLGHPVAQHNLGNIFAFGTGVTPNYAEAFKWYHQAALQGVAVSESALGAFYLQGRGAEKNYSEAIYWLKKAVDKGAPRAMSNLGSLYQMGWGATQDYDKAKELYERAIRLGDITAKYNLATMYMHGQGVKKELDRAIELLTDPANQGMVEAQYALGDIYFKEKKVIDKGDYDKARNWYLKAAQNGFVHAQSRLGLFYEVGIGVMRDTNQAISWYTKAADQGHEHSKHRIEALSKR